MDQAPYTTSLLSSIDIKESDILNIVKSLDANKAHGHDDISIRMLKLSQKSILNPLKLIFENYLRTRLFPDQWKKANVVPIHKKGDKQLIENYRPASLLPICGKVFERLIFSSWFNYFTESHLLSPHQSGFIPGDSCVQQLISITHEIYNAFDCNPSLEVRGVFLDISKAFYKAWHDGLIYKLKRNGINGDLLRLIESFFSDRYQRVILNGQTSNWNKIKAGFPQGSILSPLFFLIYINDLPSKLRCSAKLFADDTSLFPVVENVNETTTSLNKDLENINKWAHQWKMSFNADPTKMAQEVLFSRKKSKIIHPSLIFNGKDASSSESQKHLGLVLVSKLNFNMHLQGKFSIINNGIALLRKLRHSILRKLLLSIYKTFLRPHLDYCDIIYDKSHNEKFTDTLESIQYNAALAITGAIKGTSREKLYNELGLEYLKDRRWMRRLCLFHKIYNVKSPKCLYNLIPSVNRFYVTRNNTNVPSFNCRTEYFKNSFFPNVITEWNKLDINIENMTSYTAFKNALLSFIRPKHVETFGIHNPIRMQLLTRLRLGFSHLNEHKFRHNFRDFLNPLCECKLESETTSHFFLRCDLFQVERTTLP